MPYSKWGVCLKKERKKEKRWIFVPLKLEYCDYCLDGLENYECCIGKKLPCTVSATIFQNYRTKLG